MRFRKVVALSWAALAHGRALSIFLGNAGPFRKLHLELSMPTCLGWDAMNNRTHHTPRPRAHKARHRAAVLVAAIGGLAVLAAGCGGGGGLPVAAPSHTPGLPSASSGPGSAQQKPGHGKPGRPPVSGGSMNPAQESAGTGNKSGVTGGALFGGTNELAVENAKLGRKLAIVREYYHIGEKFPTPQSKHLMSTGSTLLVSLDSVGAHGPSYSSIAAGRDDGTIRAFLKAMSQSARSYHLGAIYISFEHEADNPQHVPLGSPAAFRRAWDHVHQLAQSAHLNWNDGGHLHWVMILMHTAYFRELPKWQTGGPAGAYWPGANEVDVVAADGYNHIGCKQSSHGGSASSAVSLNPGDLFNPVISFAHSHGGLPVFITEWGTQAGRYASRQPAFIGQMRAYVTANREIAAAMYFDSRNPNFPSCSSIINNLPASVSAMAAMGRSARLQGRVTSS
jgi:hypothetical protein